MFFRKTRNDHIGGDYQLNAALHGPMSQRLWHIAKQDIIKEYLHGSTYRNICDAGCGSGVVANTVAGFLPDAEVVGLDVFEESIRFARQQFCEINNLRFEQKDLLVLPTKNSGLYDFIYSMEVIEHFRSEDVRHYLKNLARMGSDKTRYLISTPDYRSLWPLIEWSLDAFHLVPRLAGHQHLTRFNRKSLEKILTDEGFRVLNMQNFCGLSPFAGHISLAFAQWIEKIERKLQMGNILLCEFEKS